MTHLPKHIQRYVAWHERALANLERRMNHLFDLLAKANFNPGQLRLPAGNPDGGQWVSDGDTADDAPEVDAADGEDPAIELIAGKPLTPGSIRSLFRDYGGHHIVPLAEALLRGNLLSPEAVDVLSKNTVGGDGRLKDQSDTENPHRGRTTAHRESSQAIRELTERYIKENGIDKSNLMTGDQARKLVEGVENSNDPRIRDYLRSLREYAGKLGEPGRARSRGIGRGNRGRE